LASRNDQIISGIGITSYSSTPFLFRTQKSQTICLAVNYLHVLNRIYFTWASALPAISVIAPQFLAATISSGTNQEPPQHETFGRAK